MALSKLCPLGGFPVIIVYQGHLWTKWYCCHHSFSPFSPISNWVNQALGTSHPLMGHEESPRRPYLLQCRWGRSADTETVVEDMGPPSSCSLFMHSTIICAQSWLHHFWFKMSFCWALSVLWLLESPRAQVMVDSYSSMVIWCPIVYLFPKALGQDNK